MKLNMAREVARPRCNGVCWEVGGGPFWAAIPLGRKTEPAKAASSGVDMDIRRPSGQPKGSRLARMALRPAAPGPQEQGAAARA